MSSLTTPEFSYQSIRTLREACESCDVVGIKALIKAIPAEFRAAYVNSRDPNGGLTIYWGVFFGHPEVVQTLLEVGADVNARDNIGASSLHWAVSRDNLPLVQMLLAAGADVNARDNRGESPLHWAVNRGHLPVVQMLLAVGVDPRVGMNSLVEIPAEKKDRLDGAYSEALVLSREAQELAGLHVGMGPLLLGFQGALASETLRGIFIRLVVFLDRVDVPIGARTSARVEVIGESGSASGSSSSAAANMAHAFHAAGVSPGKTASIFDKKCREQIRDLRDEFRGIFTKVPKGVGALAELLNRPATHDIRPEAAKIIEAAFARTYRKTRSADAMAGYQRIYAMLREDGIVSWPLPATGAGARAGAGSGAHAPGI